ncbi:unnamed protein product, partial [Nippostrongylus brasiliensis]|uniref:Vacuolar protein sorting-associated protein 54 (inferred by orthology to a C. elegans protein) n=1 Tax=Nippostrongylus brasiliensis TaxID=27835 RepID=A0A0N4XJY7_NIPBR
VLALASRSLQLIVYFVPFVSSEAELSLRDDQKHLMRHFKQALTDYGDHIKEITSKLVSVIDHHTENCLDNTLFETVHEHFKDSLKLHLARISISPHDSLKYGLVSQDYAFYAQSLRAMSSCSELHVESLNDVIYGR